METLSDLLEKTDKELCWQNSAELLRENDLSVIAREEPVCRIESIIDCNQRVIDMLSFKVPIYDQNDIPAGVLGVSIDSSTYKLSELFEILTQVVRVFETDYPQLASKNILPVATNNPIRHDLISQLTQREADCVNCLVKGLSAKETGKVLGLSHRTVEVYYEKIKAKLGCRRKVKIVSLLYSADVLRSAD